MIIDINDVTDDAGQSEEVRKNYEKIDATKKNCCRIYFLRKVRQLRKPRHY